MQILVLGGDGFCGWPTSLHLSAAGHDVVIVDNFARRNADVELEVESLTPIRPLGVRRAAWQEVDGTRARLPQHRRRAAVRGAARPARRAPPRRGRPLRRAARRAVLDEEPAAQALHGRQQRQRDAATCSPRSSRPRSTRTSCTSGTMGVYGYGGGAMIPEGYLTVRMDGSDGHELEREILFPPSPGSVYHLTKTLDQLMLAFFNKNDGVRVTDLHQGIVWGTQTEQTRLDDRLINRFDYDGDYGTVLNRFLMQAAIGYPAHRARHRRPDPRVHPHPGLRPLHPARGREPAGGRRARADLQPDDRGPPRHRPRRARGAADRARRSTSSTTRARRRRRTTSRWRTAGCSTSGSTRSGSRTRCCRR